MAVDPAGLFNLATLEIHVPPHALGPGPPSTSVRRRATDGPAAQLNRAVDEWVTGLCRAPEREEAYYGKMGVGEGGRPHIWSIRGGVVISPRSSSSFIGLMRR